MNKQPISVTLAPDSIAWLRAQMVATGARSLSETLDRVIERARSSSATPPPARSVVGLVQMAEEDPDLEVADAAVRALFAAHIAGRDAERAPRSRGARRPRRAKEGRGG